MVKCIAILFFFFTPSFLLGQTFIEYFGFKSMNKGTQKAYYSTIKTIDSRFDNSNLGVIHDFRIINMSLKPRSKPVVVMNEEPFVKMFQRIVDAYKDNTVEEGELLIQIRQFNFWEKAHIFKEEGFFRFKAYLYQKVNLGYKVLDEIDTIISSKSAMIANRLFKGAQDLAIHFIEKNINRKSNDDKVYTYKQITDEVELLEKKIIPIYNDSIYQNGIFKTFESFKNNRPDINEIETTMYGDSLLDVKAKNEKGRFKYVKPKKIYAVCVTNQLYIATDYGFYKLTRYQHNFFFTGYARVQEDVIAEIINGLLATTYEDILFVMKLDHITGDCIRLKEIQPQKRRNDYSN